MTNTLSTIVIAAPIRPTDSSGNDVTANRWTSHLRYLGFDVTVIAVDEAASGPDIEVARILDRADMLIALHARRSANTSTWWANHHPDRPLVVALTGTDLYRDMPDSTAAMASTEMADHLIVLQPTATQRLQLLRPGWETKTTTVYQSAERPLPLRQPIPSELRVIVLAHLREVKDPLLAARAAGRLDRGSRVTVHHAGRPFDEGWAEAALAEEAANHRYHWHRELDRSAALTLLASGHVLACTSLTEGGANVVTEAIAIGVPVIGTRIDGNIGLLGADYPGLTPVGDVDALAELLARLESDPHLLSELQRRTDQLRPITDPVTERAALASILAAL